MSTTAALPNIAPAGGGLTVVRALPSGALRIAGYLTRWTDLDQVGDRFRAGSFSTAIEHFLNTPDPQLRWHHQPVRLGRVDSLTEDAVGVQLVATVDYVDPDDIGFERAAYEGILSKKIDRLSVGGYFDRAPGLLPDGSREIVGISEITECSATHAPALRDGTNFRVIDAGADPSADALAAAKLAELRAEVFLMAQGR
ncbi:HK97 family phage prohead protease [Patulibacter sp.]|uniref:HK97 family phage prohead protease n=1 Tax=Patulibacter sp. TaxID=1912859 RepID=UPI00271AA8BF|nr:HK97 family phage prohead protease [Patulibacter sp.]MDO9409687.1 HK97 family phage prohead protease [Patulibacter sp.]